MPIPASVPHQVLSELRSHILGGCDLAAEGYFSAKGREDAVTGALGERLRLKEKLIAVKGEGTWKIAVSWNKFRSAKGKSGEEREIGADGIVQFELFREYGEEVYTKGLLFQAKMEDDSDYKRLQTQCSHMEELARRSSSVIQYGPQGYKAMDGKQALEQFRRQSNTMPDFTEGLPLGEYIVERFLECEVGTEKLFYEHDTETLIVPKANEAFRRIRSRLNKISIKAYAPTPTF
jgi:hypothetical protein